MVVGCTGVIQIALANDKMSIGNSGATPNSIKKSIGEKGSKGGKEIHAYTRSRSFDNSIFPVGVPLIHREWKVRKE